MSFADRDYLALFLTAINGSPIALQRPVCRGWLGDYQITGKHGHVLADHPGYLLYVAPGESRRRWGNIKREFGFATLMQDGDDEGCFRLDRLPTKDEGEVIRGALGIRRRRLMTPEALANLERARASIKTPVSASPMRPADEVATGVPEAAE